MARPAGTRLGAALRATKPFEAIPEVPGLKLPVFGTTFSKDMDFLKREIVIKGRGGGVKLHKMWSHLHAKYVDPAGANMLRFTLGPSASRHKSAVLVFDPEDVRTVLGGEGEAPCRGEGMDVLALVRQRATYTGIYGPDNIGMVLEEGDGWLRTRMPVQKELMRPKNALPYLGQMNDVADEFVDHLRRDRDTATLVKRGSITQALKMYGLESIARVTLGTRLGCLDDDPDPRLAEAVGALSAALEPFLSLQTAPLWKLFPFCPRVDPNFKKVEDNIKVFLNFTLQKMREAREEFATREGGDGENLPLLEKFVRKFGEDSTLPSITAVDLISGGSENVASLACWLLYHLARHPDKQERLREEVSAIGEKISEHDIGHGLRYARAFMKESSRVTPTIFGGTRVLARDVAVRGYRIPAGTLAMWDAHVLGRDPKSFPDPDVFRPERWIEDKERIHPYAVQPFGHGRRDCVGRRFAELELLALLAALVREFRMEWAAADYDAVEPVFKIMYWPDRELAIRFVDVRK